MHSRWFYRDRKPWEAAIWRWRISRWCDGAPCNLTAASSGHSVRVWWVGVRNTR